jgi:hypothetical protein
MFHHFNIGYPAGKALPAHNAYLYFRHIQPTGVLGGRMYFKPLPQVQRLFSRERFVQ